MALGAQAVVPEDDAMVVAEKLREVLEVSSPCIDRGHR